MRSRKVRLGWYDPLYPSSGVLEIYLKNAERKARVQLDSAVSSSSEGGEKSSSYSFRF